MFRARGFIFRKVLRTGVLQIVYRLPEDGPSDSKHCRTCSLTKAHFVCLYYEIILQCTVQKKKEKPKY